LLLSSLEILTTIKIILTILSCSFCADMLDYFMEIMNLNLNLLKAFWAVYREGGINSAARFLNLEPPAITYNIRQLETQLGHKLFITANKKTTPTKEAEMLFPLVNSSFEKILQGKKQLDAVTGHGTIRLGLPVLFENFFLRKFLKDFAKKHPGINLVYYHSPKNEYLQPLENGEHDISIMLFANKSKNDTIKFQVLKTLRMTFFTNKSFADKNKLNGTITTEQLLSLPFIAHMKSRVMIDNLEEQLGVNLNPIRASSVNQAYDRVMDGQGIGYLFEEFLDAQNNDDIVKLELTDKPLANIELICACSQKTSTDVILFIRELKAYFSNY
jgi:DNA-binding transcriptional LysR family regulator